MSTTFANTHRVSEDATYTRFDAAQLLQHAAVFVSFTMLVITGLAERYYQAGWAESVLLAFGGFDSTRLVHRIFGVMFTASYANHFAYIMYVVFGRRTTRPTMLPSMKDAADAVLYLKYSLGMTKQVPEADRYDFRQKFEYWGMVFGGVVMIATGILLTYPMAITAFLPGEVVPAAKEFHRNEAMLAFLTIVIWHLYSAHLRPGNFPMDRTIITGKMSRKRMEEEHPLELKAADRR